MKRLKRLTAIFAMGAAAVMLTPTAGLAQYDEEWEESSRYYEDDAWFDISEWFDLNDYNPTNETVGVWDDESFYTDDTYDYYDPYDDYEYSYYDDYESGFYEDDEYGYNDEYAYDYFDEGYYDDYDLDDEYGDWDELYGDWDELYGYDERYEEDDWFYDYYDDGYLTFDDVDDDEELETASRYYDYDGDGFYDAVTTYYDNDEGAAFDDAQYFSFNSSATAANRQKTGRQQAPSAAPQTFSGTILRVKRTSLPNARHLVVQLRTAKGSALIADLGPVAEIAQLDLQSGDQITLQGMMTTIGNKKVLMANEIQMNGETVQITRNRRRFEGEIVDVHRTKVRGTTDTLVILEQNGKKRAVDLGPSRALDELSLEEGAQLVVAGPPVNVNGRTIIMAEMVSQDGNQTNIARGIERARTRAAETAANQANQTQRQTAAAGRQQSPRAQQQQQQKQRQARVSGEILSLRKASVRGTQRQLARIESQQGRVFLVDLGPAQKLNANLQKGDQITAIGPLAQTADNVPVVIAQRLQTQQQTLKVTPSEPGRRMLQASGEIVRMGTIEIRGEQRQMVTLKTDNGRLHADLGAKEDLQMDLQQGDRITITGVMVPNQAQPVMLARQLTHQGQTATLRTSSRERQRQ